MASLGALLQTPKHCLHNLTDKPSPWVLLRVHQGTDYIETDKPSPGTLLRVHQGTDYIETDKPSPGTLLGVHQGTDYTETDKPSPGTLPLVYPEKGPRGRLVCLWVVCPLDRNIRNISL